MYFFAQLKIICFQDILTIVKLISHATVFDTLRKIVRRINRAAGGAA